MYMYCTCECCYYVSFPGRLTRNDVVKWKDVRVGDVLRLENNDFITVGRTHTTCVLL